MELNVSIDDYEDINGDSDVIELLIPPPSPPPSPPSTVSKVLAYDVSLNVLRGTTPSIWVIC